MPSRGLVSVVAYFTSGCCSFEGLFGSTCVFAWVWVRDRVNERERESVCVCVRERERVRERAGR
jgi:hypothetical protein